MKHIPLILVVDDVEANRDTLVQLLDAKGYRLAEAADGPEAIRLAKAEPPDLILLDVMMPGMDGFEVCRRLRADQVLAEVPIVLVTALDDQQSRLTGLEAGADDFISKPFNRLELSARVRGITRLNRYRRLTEAQDTIREQTGLLDQARDAILVSKLDGQITYWNRSAERVFGWPAELACTRNLAELFNEAIEVEPALAIVQEKGEFVEQISRNGSVLESRWNLMRGEDGQPKAIMLINTDITETKRLEAQLLRNQRMESIGTLAGGIAHDLNNALAPILMSAQLVRLRTADAETLHVIDILEKSATRGAEMVRQVLTFARGMDGKESTVQLKHLINDIVSMARRTFPASVAIKEELPPDVWLVAGNPTQLHQVLLNLCVNARDAMPAGGTITLRAENLQLSEDGAGGHPDAKPGRYSMISVRDTGTGIPPQVLERIFEPFFTTKEPGKGTGLGLSTVQTIVKNHNGFLKVDTAENKGTEFRLFFPAASSDSTSADTRSASLPAGNGEWILIVDDEALIRDIARQTLQAYGYHALVASNGVEAVTISAKNIGKISAMLVDMTMPLMDGPATIEAVRVVDPAIKVIVTTGSSGHGKQLQGDSVTLPQLEKPYTPEQLLHSINDLLQGLDANSKLKEAAGTA